MLFLMSLESIAVLADAPVTILRKVTIHVLASTPRKCVASTMKAVLDWDAEQRFWRIVRDPGMDIALRQKNSTN